MKKYLSLLTLAFAFVAAQAQPMNYQGRLTDTNGNVLLDGQYTLTFALYDVPEGGTAVWGPFQCDSSAGPGHGPKADLVNGRFNVIIGPNDTTDRPLNGAFGGSRYLQITVGDNPPLAPRQQILPAPEALHAVKADHATLADGINGNLNITGAFNVGGASTFNGPASFSGNVGITGNLSVSGSIYNASLINLAPSSSQMIFLGPSYGFGVQPGIEYFRSSSDFAWYRGGSHAANGPGTGGKTMMTLDGNGLTVHGEAPQTALFLNTAKGNRGSHIHYGATGDWYIRSSSVNGTVKIQDDGGKVEIGSSVGIGGAPSYPVHVHSTVNFNFNRQVGDLQNYDGGIWQHQSGAANYSVVANGYMWAPAFQATSDRRIKTLEKPSDTASDLETITKLEVTDYRYIDTDVNGQCLQKGFIAQEVQKIIPEAVSSGPGFVPNIYSFAADFQFDDSAKSLSVTVSKPHDLKVGDKVRLYSESAGTIELTVAATPTARQFGVTGCEKDPGRLFVYGKAIPDLLNLNYDRIFSTGIGAIQELTRRVKALETGQRQFAELERRAARVDALEREIAELRTVVRHLVQSRPNDTHDFALAPKR